MKYLFDTDHATFLADKRGADYAILAMNLSQHPNDQFFCCIVGFHEQVLGAHGRINRAKPGRDLIAAYRLLDNIHKAYSKIPILDFGVQAESKYLDLRALKTGVGTMDLRIAAIALANDAILLTRNSKDFGKIPGLKFEDWTV